MLLRQVGHGQQCKIPLRRPNVHSSVPPRTSCPETTEPTKPPHRHNYVRPQRACRVLAGDGRPELSICVHGWTCKRTLGILRLKLELGPSPTSMVSRLGVCAWYLSKHAFEGAPDFSALSRLRPWSVLCSIVCALQHGDSHNMVELHGSLRAEPGSLAACFLV
jgi:hypothetical protein